MARPRLQALLDLRIFVPWLLVLVFGLMMLYSVTSPLGDYADEENAASYTISRGFFERQILWAAIGIAVMLAGAMIPFWIYKDYLAWVLYGAGLIVLLILLLLPPLRGDTQRWLVLGPVGLQPSEFFKAALIFMLASLLAAQRGDPNRLSLVVLAMLLVLPPTFLVLKEPDLGTALSYLWLALPLLLWRGLHLRRILLMSAPLLSALILLYGLTRRKALLALDPADIPHYLGLSELTWLSVSWGVFLVALFLIALFYREMPVVERIVYFLGSIAMGPLVPKLWGSLLPYQQKRILVFFDPGLDQLGAGYQIFQSKVAIGSGAWFGRGYLEGTQKGLAFLPARHTDFIFSVLGEEFGFVGACVALALFAYLIIHGFRLAAKARHPFGQLLCVGASSLLLFHVFVNVGMTVGLMPVTGLPLPGMSFGGSALMAISFLLGVEMNVARHWGRY